MGPSFNGGGEQAPSPNSEGDKNKNRRLSIYRQAKGSGNPFRYLTPDVQRVIQRRFQWVMRHVPRITGWVVPGPFVSNEREERQPLWKVVKRLPFGRGESSWP